MKNISHLAVVVKHGPVPVFRDKQATHDHEDQGERAGRGVVFLFVDGDGRINVRWSLFDGMSPEKRERLDQLILSMPDGYTASAQGEVADVPVCDLKMGVSTVCVCTGARP